MKVGDRVNYKPEHYSDIDAENGIIKSIPDTEHCFVVYNCAGNWYRIEDYTAAKTRNTDLREGWK